MRIAVMLARQTISGVPLAQARLARALARRGHDVELLVGHVPPGNALPAIGGVRTRDLARPRVRSLLVPIMRHLRRERPDIVFVAEDHLVAIVLLAAILTRSRAKISGSSRVTPFDTYSSVPLSKRWWLKHAMRALSWRADALTCVSQDMVAQYRQVFANPRHVCVYNIVEDTRIAEPLADRWFDAGAPPVVMAAGSLVPWKGFDDLIRAIALLERRVRLVVLGEGGERPRLEALIAALGLEDRVRLIGHVADPLRWFACADVFALSSHVEGMPNVLVEAMLCGCTPVATDCPTGPRELLAGGRYGYLVPMRSPEGLADGIARALDAPIDPAMLREAVRPFAAATVIDRHFALLGVAG